MPIDNDEKMSKQIDNESINERHNSTGAQGILGQQFKSQPIRVKPLLDAFESDESEEDEVGDKNEDDGEGEIGDYQPETPRESKSFPDPNTANDCQTHNIEVITEEPERLSISRSLSKNKFEYCSSTPAESNHSRQLNDKNHLDQPQSVDRLFTATKDAFTVNNERNSTSRSSITGLPTDFGKADIDSKILRPTVSIPPRQSQTNIQTNIKNEVSDSVTIKQSDESIKTIKSCHEIHMQSLTTFKSELPSHSSNSIYEGPLSSSKSELLPVSVSQNLSIGHQAHETPLKHNPPPGSMRPIPSLAHKSLYQTPQNKTSTRDYSNAQSHAPTPATILSQYYQNNRHTPLQSRNAEPPHAMGQSRPPKLDNHWYKNTEGKGVRRPLAETMLSEQRSSMDNPSHNIHNHGDGQNPSRLEMIQEKSTISTLQQQELKENRRPSTFEDSVKKEEPNDANPVAVEPLRDNYSSKHHVNNHHRSNMEKTAVKREEPVPVRPSVQASVPSNIRKPMQNKIITVKGRDYVVLGFLGQGMSGEVVRVQDLVNSELRAIKCVDLSRMEKENAQSCVQEITMLSKLQAPCIIRMYDYEIKNFSLYVVMEMGETDLSKFLKSICAEKRPPLTMILYYWTEMLTAVKHIHDNGVIHSDLKPANFLLVRGRLKLIDFGIASSLNADMTSVVKNSTVGTLNYISPEALMSVEESPCQSSKYKLNYKSDVWSLGCILYGLVYGHTPFQNIQNHWAKINAITNADYKISFTQPANGERIPGFLIDVMRKCLQRDAKARPSVDQLLEVRYMPTNRPSTQNIDIPSNILLKIKRSLDDDEWRQFTEIMEQRRNC